MPDSSAIVSKVWNYAHVLKNAGVGYGDYVEQITYLLFLKLADEMTELGFDNPIPDEFKWSELSSKSGDALEIHYRHTLENLGKEPGLVGIIFRKAQNKISNPSDLQRVIKMIGDEDWSGMDVDIKGAIYEGLLEKTASSSDKGAGQYFTPRPLIRAIVEVMAPKPGQVIGDPACGTGGFLLAAHDHIQEHNKLDKAARKHLKTEALWGTDIVPGVVSLCAMNMYLHGIGKVADASSFSSGRSEAGMPSTYNYLPTPSPSRAAVKFDMILANPPFGKKGGYTIVGDDGKISTEKQEYERDEFWATTANKQLNFLQHIVSELKVGGTAAVVLPDNVLFEGGAGETIRRELLKRCNVHTLLRLPTGIFYAQGVKANVLFFERKEASETPWTKDLWIYDLRTNQHFTLKTNPLKESDLVDFVKCYKGKNQRRDASATFKKFTYEEIVARDKANLDILWLKDESLEDSENLPAPALLAAEIVESLEAALSEFRAVEEALALAPSEEP
ncbi:MAG: class I SAM-dependent DNA methyltransferase [Verrucomicrobiales bacterium]